MSKWPEVEIHELCELIVDCVNKTAPKVNYITPYKMIRTPNIRNGKIDITNCFCVEKDVYEKWTRRAKVEVGDVLLTREAPLGEVGIVLHDEKTFLGQRIMQYRVDKNKINPSFLLYSFLSPALKHQFNTHNGSGSVISHIRIPDCSKFLINLPPMPIQNKIADILEGLDRKIETNIKINNILEQMAQAIFSSWFVNFDPVKAKMKVLNSGGSKEEALNAAMSIISGKSEVELVKMQTEFPNEYDELKNTAELFPSSMQDSELGKIPSGWRILSLKDVTLELRRGISPKYIDDGGILVINQKCVRNHSINFCLARRHDSDKKKVYGREAKIGDVLINSTGVGTLGRLTPVRYIPESFVVDSHITIARCNRELLTQVRHKKN